MSTLLSAASAIDIIFFAVLAIGFVAGFLGGLARALKGFFAGVFIVLTAILLVGALMTPLCNSAGARSIQSSIEKKTAGWGVVFTSPIYADDDGYYLIAEVDGAERVVRLKDAGGDGLADKSKAALAQRLAKRFITPDNDGVSLAGIAARAITSVIVAVLAFIGFCLGLWLIFFILRRIFRRIHRSDSGALGALDRLLGAAIGMFMALVFLLVVLAILRACGVRGSIGTAPIIGYLFDHNPVRNIFSRVFG